MKNTHKLIVATLALLGVGSSAFGHVYSFTNHTKEPMRVRFQLGGFSEPWYYIGTSKKGAQPKPYHSKGATGNVLYPDEIFTVTFDASDTVTIFQSNFKRDEHKNDYARKFGFCLAYIQYAPVGTNKWSNVEPIFVESKTSNDLISASSEFTKGAGDIAGTILEAIPKTKAIGTGVKKLPLDKMVTSVGTMVQKSLCRNRHFDIIPNMIVEVTDKDKDGVTEANVAQAIGQPLFVTIAK